VHLRHLLSNLAPALLISLAGCAKKEAAAPAAQPAKATAAAPAATAAAATAGVPFAFDKLKGRWGRLDGGYVLELRSVDSTGKLNAAYFNPSPINVSQALVMTEGGQPKVFVELRDTNYPGCVYKLTYIPQSDQLAGQYFQASMQQTYDVTFVRLQE
jgi:hypothetical protein